MIILRILFLPLRLLYYCWCRLRNKFPIGDTLIHRVPDRFTLTRPAGWMAYFIPRQETHYIEYLAGLKIMAESDRLKTLALILPEMQASWVEVEEIAVRIDAIRAAGKEVVAFAEGGNIKTVYLMAAADRRYVALNSDYLITFPSAEPFFVKETLARLGVRVDSYAAGKFKSAAEMFTRSSFSPPARKAMQELLDDMRGLVSERLHETPAMTADDRQGLLRLLKNNAVLEARQLVAAGFALAELEAARFGEEVLGFPATLPAAHPFERPADAARREGILEREKQKQTEEQTAARAKGRGRRGGPRLTGERAVFQRYRRQQFRLWRLRRRPALAFVHMEGSIVGGRPGDQPQTTSINAEAFREIFKQLESGPEEAVFLYINSPGGSAAASEILYQSIAELGRSRPVFALLGPVAASGGYYIASAAHRIFAAQASITGSIGVITIRPNLKGLYQKLGVKKERIAFDRTRDLLSEAGPLSPASLQLLKKHIRSSYDLFIARVAEGRELEARQVRAVAEGRVWTGREFVRRGLVDLVGDLFHAFELYKKEAGHRADKQFLLNFYPDPRADFRKLLEERLPGLPFGTLFARLAGADARTPASAVLGAGPERALGAYLNGELAGLAGTELLYYLPARLLLRGLV